jgi:hypothetical protein
MEILQMKSKARSVSKPAVKSKSKIKDAKKGILKRIRNYIIFSIIMMVVGGSADRYRSDILYFITEGYRPAIQKIVDLVNLPAKTEMSSEKAVTVNRSNGENPDATSEIVKHKYYSLGYNENREQAN